MNDFERFISTNSLRKKDVAEYLGISPSNISAFCRGTRIPDRLLSAIKSNLDWDSSMLYKDGTQMSSGARNYSAVMEHLQEQMSVLESVVRNQAEEIAMLKTIVSFLTESRRKK